MSPDPFCWAYIHAVLIGNLQKIFA